MKVELRKDCVLDRYVVLATNRSKRPCQFKNKDESLSNLAEIDENCPFCPGNEDKTPKEIGRTGDGQRWVFRWFENKFAAVDLNGDYVVKTDNEFYTFGNAFGKHEIIVETPKHNIQLWDLDEEQLADLISIYNFRIEELSRIPGVKYVALFKNHGPAAGTSVVHSHSQVIAYNIVPFWVREVIKSVAKFEGCPYCQLLEKEKNSERHVLETEHFLTFTPYASQYPFEVVIFPKKHVRFLNELRDNFDELAIHLKRVLSKLKELNCSYNISWMNSSFDRDLHFHVKIIPRITKPGGFEFFGTHINVVTPEDAASFYRGDLK